MKKIFRYILIAGLSLGLMSCDKFFDNMEGDLSKVKAEDLMAKRPGTGISPVYTDIVTGRAVKTDLAEDTILTWDMV